MDATETSQQIRPRTIILGAPRASCAGVERAIQCVEQALEQFGPPVYVRKQIVHNSYVVSALEEKGAHFVEEIEQVPLGATVVFSAHGVAPAVRSEARDRDLRVVDATCPLVSKVHAEARRFAAAGRTIVLIGHEEHEEVVGTRGEAPDRVVVVDTVEDVARLEVEDPERVAQLTQTTLSIDETAETAAALRERFPALSAPAHGDICYATQNRQDAVKALASESDLVLVIGSTNSSNAVRLVEVAEREGTPARLIEDESAVTPELLGSGDAVGITAGASTPEALVRRVVAAIAVLGPTTVRERSVRNEDVTFKPPPIR